MSEQSAEQDHIDVVSSSTTEYGIRDWTGEVLTMPAWSTPDDVVAEMHAHGLRAYSLADVIVRTTTTTTTTTGWENI